MNPMKTPLIITLAVIVLGGITALIGGICHSASRPFWHYCAWCKHSWNNEGERQPGLPPVMPEALSHGICKECLEIKRMEVKAMNGQRMEGAR